MRSIAFTIVFTYGSLSISSAGALDDAITMVVPVPGSELVEPATTIIMRSSHELEAAGLQIDVQGSKSGNHQGKGRVSDDGRTLIFKPAVPFAWGESVNVKVGGPSGQSHPFGFRFTTTTQEQEAPLSTRRTMAEDMPDEPPSVASASSGLRFAGSDTLPLNFPYLGPTVLDNPSPGRLFIAPYRTDGVSGGFVTILENDGHPFMEKELARGGLDFKAQVNGVLTYYDLTAGYFYGLDSTLAIVDSFRCGNGYSTDPHELQILPNGHALVMANDPKIIDMSAIVPGGNPHATVTGLIIQELDVRRDVVFEWRSWDHFQITDAPHLDLTAQNIDAVHGNAIEPDHDGNILISSRHLDEITKINRQTGEIIWRLGGKHNEFTIMDDEFPFTYQHNIRRLANGNITFFDNGNWRSPQYSRAVEYRLDEVARTAVRVWQFRNTPDVYGSALGNVQRLANGNTLIAWGTSGVITEVRPDGSKAYEVSLPSGFINYRAFRFPWRDSTAPAQAPTVSTFRLEQNYPNPFNGTTTIITNLSAPTRVRLVVFNILGQKVASLFDGIQGVGIFRYRFDGTDLPSGMYFYSLSEGNAVLTRKMLLLR